MILGYIKKTVYLFSEKVADDLYLYMLALIE